MPMVNFGVEGLFVSDRFKSKMRYEEFKQKIGQQEHLTENKAKING